MVSATYAVTSSGEPTFLNIGRDYPDPGRFTVIIWGENRSAFPGAPEETYALKDVCVTGTITSYQGVPQIEANSPSQIEIVS